MDLPRAEEIRRTLPRIEEAEAAAERVRALSDPTRLALASALLECEELCVCDLAWISARPQNLVSHHMRMLRRSGLARSRRDGKLVLYALTPQGRSLLRATLPRKPGTGG